MPGAEAPVEAELELELEAELEAGAEDPLLAAPAVTQALVEEVAEEAADVEEEAGDVEEEDDDAEEEEEEDEEDEEDAEQAEGANDDEGEEEEPPEAAEEASTFSGSGTAGAAVQTCVKAASPWVGPSASASIMKTDTRASRNRSGLSRIGSRGSSVPVGCRCMKTRAKWWQRNRTNAVSSKSLWRQHCRMVASSCPNWAFWASTRPCVWTSAPGWSHA